ncbi:MAG: hypothetical protein ACNS64_01135 [Candidatus Halalkalibacterium sp. M3_1C_030]
MQASKSLTIILGILTFLPFIGLLGIFAFVFYEFLVLMLSDTPANLLLYFTYFGYILPVFSGYLLVYLALGIFYFVHVIQNQLLDTEKKVLWIAVLIALNGLAMPFYWYVYLWKNTRERDQLKANAW